MSDKKFKLKGSLEILNAQNNNDLLERKKAEKAALNASFEKSIENYIDIQESGINSKDDPMDSMNLLYREN